MSVLTPLPDSDARLAALEREAAHQSALSAGDGRSWVGARDGIRPVVIVGAGQAGLVLARGLRRRGIDDVVVIDAAPADAAGPWTTYARMHTLRTPKDIAWPTWGTPAVSPRAWFEAVYGIDAWDAIEYFPTIAWQGFLRWYREVSALTVVPSTRVRSLAPTTADGPIQMHLDGPDGEWMLPAQHVVLATGIEGAGGRHIPALLRELPAERVHHTHDAIDFEALAGLRIGILGAGTGAFDNAATALEHGAASVDVHMRRPAMPQVSPYRWMEFAGLIENYGSFTDQQKWAFNVHLSEVDQPATQNALWRAHAFDSFRFLTSSPWQSVEWTGSEIAVTTPHGIHHYDVVLAATGIVSELARRPELANVAADAVLWSDRLDPASTAQNPGLAAFPYLDDDFGLVSRSTPEASALSRIHMFNHGARLSQGMLSHQIPGLVGGATKLAAALSRRLFERDADALLREYLAYDVPVGVHIGRRAQPPTPTETAGVASLR
ncbi:FAD-dependent oxidoreductase [Microbacterium testaceum]|uniref:FAD-dependent oxidoreductase n=1 Tax=Microbacterium testaceum TaxID=2033 RepID=UPI001144E94E|nr:FAD-dependent oxidoreductase [Microbacterium testaceum]WJS91194.1 FAD-dependent oxidoreductase [Microbacterium testaceum]